MNLVKAGYNKNAPLHMNITEETLYKLYIVENLTMQQIADRLNRCRAGIFKLLKKFNIKTLAS